MTSQIIPLSFAPLGLESAKKKGKNTKKKNVIIIWWLSFGENIKNW